MRTRYLLFAAIATIAFGSESPAQLPAIKVGDTVQIARDGVELRQGHEVLGTLEEEECVTVRQIDGEWLWCEAVQAKGWIRQGEVRPFWSKVVRSVLAAKGVKMSRGWVDETTAPALAGSRDVVYLGEATSGALPYLKELPNLRSLRIPCDDKLTDASLAQVGELTQLERLSLGGQTNITDAGLVHIARLTHLRKLELNLPSSKVTGTGLGTLKGLKQLRSLDLSKSPVTDAGLAQIKGLAQLRHLSLWGTLVTDAGLEHLSELRALESLDLSETRVTEIGLKRVGEMLPKCKFSASGRAPIPQPAPAGQDRPPSSPPPIPSGNVSPGTTAIEEPDSPVVPLPSPKPAPTKVDVGQKPRTWTDATGKFKTEATLLGFFDGKVTLRKADGSTKIIPIEKLSPRDQEYVRQTTVSPYADPAAGGHAPTPPVAAAPEKATFEQQVDQALSGTGIEGCAICSPMSCGYRVFDRGRNVFRGIEALATIEKLDNLYVHSPTDEAVEHLARLRNVKRLELRETTMSADGVAKLRKALPQCEIVVEPAVRPPQPQTPHSPPLPPPAPRVDPSS